MCRQPNYMILIIFHVDGQTGQSRCNPQTGGVGGGACGGSPAAAAAPESGGQQQQTAEEQKAAQREYLQHVGAQVSTLLEPFGIDVDVEVEEREPGIRHRGQNRGQFRGQGLYFICSVITHQIL